MKFKRACKILICVIALTAALSLSAFAFSAQGGTVTSKGSLNLRSGPSTSYSVLTRLPSGTKVLVLDDSGAWYKVAYNGTIGYVSDDYLSLSSKMDVNAGYAKVTANTKLRLRSGPGTSYSILTELSKGTTAEIIGVNNGWVKVNYKTYTGYLSSDYITVVSTGSSSNTSDSSTSTSADGLKVVSSGNLRLRTGPGTSYDIITSLRPGTIVKNLGVSGNWYKVQYNSYIGYVSGDYVVAAAYTDSGSVDDTSSYDGIIVTSKGRLNMRSGAGTSYSIITKLPSGAVAKLVSTHGDWYKVTYNGNTGYVSAEYCKLVDYSSASSNNSSGNVSADGTSSSNVRENVVAYAKKFLGTKYSYGGNTPSTGFDCSGFTKYVLAEYGYTLPRTSKSQYTATTRINKSELKLGDLVFFSNSSSGGDVGHVGIYIGSNNFIHAENSSTGVVISSLSSSYYSSHYIGSGRIIFD